MGILQLSHASMAKGTDGSPAALSPGGG